MADLPTPLEMFQLCRTDEERLALGLTTLRAAWKEAEDSGWAPDVYEYLYSLENNVPLNRPFGTAK